MYSNYQLRGCLNSSLLNSLSSPSSAAHFLCTNNLTLLGSDDLETLFKINLTSILYGR